MTAYDIARAVYEENIPIDWAWINYQKRHYTEKELKDICKDRIYYFFKGVSKNMIGRAASELYRMLY